MMLLGTQKEKFPRGLNKSDGICINCWQNCPKQISQKQPNLQLDFLREKKNAVVTSTERQCRKSATFKSCLQTWKDKS